MNFIAIDVETANADYSSICQIGIAIFNNGVCSKHRKAEELIESGISIRILSENDFVEICNLMDDSNE